MNLFFSQESYKIMHPWKRAERASKAAGKRTWSIRGTGTARFLVREMHKLADVILAVTWTVSVAGSLWALLWQVTIKARLNATTRSVHTHRASYRKRESVRFLSSSFQPCQPASHAQPLAAHPDLASLSSERPALQFTVYVDGLMLPAACTARLASLRYQPSTPTQPPSIVLTPALWFSPPRPPFFVADRGRRQHAVDRSASKTLVTP